MTTLQTKAVELIIERLEKLNNNTIKMSISVRDLKTDFNVEENIYPLCQEMRELKSWAKSIISDED